MICKYCGDEIEIGEEYYNIDVTDADVHECCRDDYILEHLDNLVEMTYCVREE